MDLISRQLFTASGIVLPETAVEKSQEGIVLAVGPGVSSDLIVGNHMLFAKYTGIELRLPNDHPMTILSESNILAIIESEEETEEEGE